MTASCGGKSRGRRIQFAWTEEEAETIARWLENIDIPESDTALIDLKERFYRATGRDFLLDEDGRYMV
ncbi:MAG: hypothetical protein QOF27_1556 [Gaiellaceae bacterium]|jgi:hypothetical protein|nr:hypothetical protein [Gaiellaceae bacterium]MDX6440334.1 hypothetical protein [Gaiellaceae bacterium]